MTVQPLRRLRSRVVLPTLNNPDTALLLTTAALVGFGIVMVFNASYFYAMEHFGDPLFFFRKHIASICVGVVLCAAASRLRLEFFERGAYFALIVAVVLLVAVLIPGIGVVRNNARRWLDLGFSFQPAEFAKIAVILFLARSIARHQEEIRSFRVGLLPHLAIVGGCSALIAMQPDLGTAVILMVVLVFMLFVGGARPLHLVGLGSMALLAIGSAVWIAPWRMRRISAFIDPWTDSQGTAFQLVQSLIAFGSGGLFGAGLGESKQKMFYLPEAHNDFIFALVGEELGLAGGLFVLVLFAALGVRGFRVALRHPDPFGMLLAFGITVSLLVEALINVGVVLGLLPTKGLPLPFISYGGSAMMGMLLQVGILAALSRVSG